MNLNFFKKLNNKHSNNSSIVTQNEKSSSTNPNNKTSITKSVHSSDIYNSPQCDSIRNNISIRQSALILNYHDMAYVASLAENSLVITPPVKQYHPGKLSEEYDRVFNENHDFSINNFRENIAVSKKLDAHTYTRSQLFEHIRAIYPDFAQNMQNKISSKDYELYHTTMRKFRKSLSPEIKCGPLEMLSDALKEAQHNISKIISSPSFAEACKIEDSFIISEINTFLALLSKSTESTQASAKKTNIELGNGTRINIIDFANKMKAERMTRLKKYSEINRLYNKLETSQEIKPASSATIEAPEDHSEH